MSSSATHLPRFCGLLLAGIAAFFVAAFPQGVRPVPVSLHAAELVDTGHDDNDRLVRPEFPLTLRLAEHSDTAPPDDFPAKGISRAQDVRLRGLRADAGSFASEPQRPSSYLIRRTQNPRAPPVPARPI